MRKLTIILFLLPIVSFGQPFGNEWLDFNQDYYKIMVPENAVYKITYTDLQSAGLPIESVDPQLLQIFRRGQEIAIHVEGEEDGSFDPTDYLLFYGQRNDGQLDEELYVAADAQPHQYLALYADSAAYFLTAGASSGKRMATIAAFSGATPDAWVEHEVISVLQNDYAPGITNGENTQLTQYDYGEGFTGSRAIEVSQPNRDIDLTSIDLPYLSGPDPRIELVIIGRNNQLHNYEVLVGPDAGNLLSIGTYQFSGYNHQTIETSINWSSISPSGNLKIRVSVIDDGGNRSSISISSAKINYARVPDLASKTHFEVDTEAKTSGANTVVFSNINPDIRAYDITSPANVSILEDGDIEPTELTIGFNDASITRKIALARPETFFSIRRARLRPINPADHNYLIISHEAIMQPAGGYNDVVEAYAGYRASMAGGGFDTLVVDIAILYNQFSYGQPTPVAIYRFMKYMAANGSPRYLFLIGKGLNVTEKYHKTTNWTSSLSDYVPTGGYPGSDLAFTIGLGATQNAPAVPVGRLSVMQPVDVANYLEKVIEMAATPYDALWRKDLLHLSGGDNLNEIEIFKGYINDLGVVANGHFFGGEVTTFSKQTTNSVEEINVAAEVNAGVNIITFFGHSSPNTSDIDIGKVSNPQNGYNNKGKYPVILMNGCETGNIYERANLFGEDWIKTADKGATCVIAHSSYGYPYMLRIWSSFFYQFGYADSTYIEKSVGEIMVKTGESLMTLAGPNPNIIFKSQVQQMGLQGDPAVKLFGTYTPDFEISSNNVEFLSFNGGDVTAEEDSFAIVLGVRNFGAYIQDSLDIVVQRTLPDFSVTYDTLTFPPIRYLDTLQFTLSNMDLEVAGVNVFDITLDPLNKISELDELNNLESITKTIKTSGTSNILPFNYSLDAIDSIDLVIQPGNPLMTTRNYLVEIDTSADFSSIYNRQFNLTGSKLIEVNNISFLSQDTATYYWRSKYAVPGENESDEWQQSSFSVISGADPGWAQLAYPQHVENDLSGLAPDDSKKEISFLNSSVSVDLRVPGNSSDTLYFHAPSNTIVRDTRINIDGVNYLFFVDRFQPFTYCYNNRLNIVAFDKESSLPYAAIFGNQVDSWSCGRSPQIINSYNGGKSLDEIIDAVGEGDKVIIFTIGNFDFNSLSPATIAKLEDMGADASVLLSKEAGGPYLMIGAKGAGAGNSIAELVADPGAGVPADEQTVTYAGELKGTYSQGRITTRQLGPARDWQSLYLDVNTPDPEDYFAMDVVGYNLEGEATLLFSGINNPVTDISSIDATIYPFLKLELAVADTVNLSAPQLDKWLVNFEPTVEGYLRFDSLNQTADSKIELNEGEELLVKMSFANISDKFYNVDSLLVRYTSFNKQTRLLTDEDSFKIMAPVPGETIPVIISLETRGKVGLNNLSVIVNPMLDTEQNFNNNDLSMPDYLNVVRDNANPVLDVSFDGEYIFDGDIVSPNPNIAIIIRDDNPYLLKADTAGVNILLKRPCESCVFERIALSGSEIVWTAEDDKEPFTIDFTPRDLENGIYQLQVQVEDETGNLSGAEPYNISFEVINESTVTNFYPYPNPFSTSVKFIFTLTGNELPDELMIRIMTVSGRVVKEIMQDELGPLRIGNNVTDYAWNGRDEFGDQLANGVYLYKVFMRRNGQNIDLRPSAGDRGFKNGYGKLYLLR